MSNSPVTRDVADALSGEDHRSLIEQLGSASVCRTLLMRDVGHETTRDKLGIRTLLGCVERKQIYAEVAWA